MTAPNTTTTPTSPDSVNSSTPPSGEGTAPPEWRVPMTDPREWARGKTASEILAISTQMASALQTLASRPQPAPPPPRSAPVSIADDDVMTGKDVRTLLEQASQPVVSHLQSLQANVAHANLVRVRDSHPKLFQKYGHEVDALLVNVPIEHRTIDTIENIVKIVRGDHVEDLARELAQDMFSGDPTLRSNGSSGSNRGYSPVQTGRMTESEELPADYRAILQEKGITEETLREFCASQNITAQEWFEKAKKHKTAIFTDRSTRGGT
jgi:hypothetical protein